MNHLISALTVHPVATAQAAATPAQRSADPDFTLIFAALQTEAGQESGQNNDKAARAEASPEAGTDAHSPAGATTQDDGTAPFAPEAPRAEAEPAAAQETMADMAPLPAAMGKNTIPEPAAPMPSLAASTTTGPALTGDVAIAPADRPPAPRPDLFGHLPADRDAPRRDAPARSAPKSPPAAELQISPLAQPKTAPAPPPMPSTALPPTDLLPQQVPGQAKLTQAEQALAAENAPRPMPQTEMKQAGTGASPAVPPQGQRLQAKDMLVRSGPNRPSQIPAKPPQQTPTTPAAAQAAVPPLEEPSAPKAYAELNARPSFARKEPQTVPAFVREEPQVVPERPTPRGVQTAVARPPAAKTAQIPPMPGDTPQTGQPPQLQTPRLDDNPPVLLRTDTAPFQPDGPVLTGPTRPDQRAKPAPQADHPARDTQSAPPPAPELNRRQPTAPAGPANVDIPQPRMATAAAPRPRADEALSPAKGPAPQQNGPAPIQAIAMPETPQTFRTPAQRTTDTRWPPASLPDPAHQQPPARYEPRDARAAITADRTIPDGAMPMMTAVGPNPAPVTPAPAPHSAPLGLAPAHEIAAQITDQMRVHLPLQPGQPIRIQLQPIELGAVDMQLHIGTDEARISITVERPETLDMMRRHLDLLSQDMARLGHDKLRIDLAQHQNGGQHGGLPDQRGGHTPHQQAEAPPGNTPTAEAPFADLAEPPAPPRRAMQQTGMDLRL